jgi:hypothetical protein
MKNKTVSKVSLHQANQLFLQQSLNIAEGKLLQQQIGHTRYRVQRTMTIFFYYNMDISFKNWTNMSK